MKKFPHLLIAGLLALSLFASANAQENGQAASVDDVLRAAAEAIKAETEADAAREAAFIAERDKQKERLEAVTQKSQALSEDIKTLEATFKVNEAEIAAKKKELNEKLGSYGAMFDVVRQTAGNTAGALESSLISAQYPGRAESLATLSKSRELPDFSEVSKLWLTMLKEIAEQGKIESFTAPVIRPDGNETRAVVTRIGTFNAIKNGTYVTFEPGLGRLKDLQRQPGGKYLSAAASLENAKPGELVGAAIDPSRGSILGLLVQTPSLEERIHQGGFVGYVILGVCALGMLIGLFKILTLQVTSWHVSWQKRRLANPSKSNPLGRILTSVENINISDTDAIDRKLDEVIMQETPRLDSGLAMIKLLAAVAPLLGLLGTVVGMIVTFQSITLFGTGDPKLMAGGISQALVTTVLGLVTAIPLLLLHSVASGTSRRIGEVLEEQAAGLIARRLQQGQQPVQPQSNSAPTNFPSQNMSGPVTAGNMGYQNG